MTRRIILHVGSPKCGSTFLQQAMLRNAARLERAGIRYPHDGGGHPGNAADLASLDRATLEAWFAGGIHTLVLSHEDLYGLPKRGEALARLVAEDGTEVQIVAFLRPFSEFMFGDYSQFMKQHFETFLAERTPYGGRDFEAFTARRVKTLTPAAFLRGWQRMFPARPLMLEPHSRIRPVFETLLPDHDPLDWKVPAGQTNPSLRMEDCDRLAAAIRDPAIPATEVRQMFRDAFHRVAEPDAGRSAARRDWIETRFAPQNAALMKEFGFDNRLPDRSGAAAE